MKGTRKSTSLSGEGMYYDLIVSGFGGQGVLFIGNLLAYAAMSEGRNVTFLPSYGVEMRGGTANCTVVISSKPIGSPVVGRPVSVIVMNRPSLSKFQERIKPDGLLILNGSLVDPGEVTRTDIECVTVPVNEIAAQNGNAKLANMVALGAYLEKTSLIRPNSAETALSHVLAARHHHLIPANLEAMEKGRAYVKK
jgi:2-oxoglutarate ferredoxin oxidoreductase subunit gamma